MHWGKIDCHMEESRQLNWEDRWLHSEKYWTEERLLYGEKGVLREDRMLWEGRLLHSKNFTAVLVEGRLLHWEKTDCSTERR